MGVFNFGLWVRRGSLSIWGSCLLEIWCRGPGSRSGGKDYCFFKRWLPQQGSRAKRSLKIADSAGRRDRGVTLLPDLSSHAYHLSYVFGLLSGQSSPCPSPLSNLRELSSQKDTLVSLDFPWKKHTPFSLPLLSIKWLYGIWKSWGPPSFSCNSNMLKFLTFLCTLNSMLVAMFGPTSALSTHTDTM